MELGQEMVPDGAKIVADEPPPEVPDTGLCTFFCFLFITILAGRREKARGRSPPQTRSLPLSRSHKRASTRPELPKGFATSAERALAGPTAPYVYVGLLFFFFFLETSAGVSSLPSSLHRVTLLVRSGLGILPWHYMYIILNIFFFRVKCSSFFFFLFSY